MSSKTSSPSSGTPPASPGSSTLVQKVDYRNLYRVGKTLGQGAFGKVKLVTRKSDGVDFAAKLVNTSEWSTRERQQFGNEIKNLNELNHESIVRLYEVYEYEPRSFALVMELASGGELFDRIQSKGSFSEDEARLVLRALLEALAYMHKKGIAHRDLKPENIMFDVAGPDGKPKLTDFGFAKKAQPIDEGVDAAGVPAGALKTRLGSPNYVAPEILTTKTGYDTSVDVWSMGVILYILLCGYFPFFDQNERELYRQIKSGKFEMPEEEWAHVSKEAKDLVRQMLTLDPKKRISASKALRHKWLRGAGASGDMPPETLAAFADLNRIRKLNFKAAGKTVAAALRANKSDGTPVDVGDVASLAIQKACRAASASEKGLTYADASCSFGEEVTGGKLRVPVSSTEGESASTSAAAAARSGDWPPRGTGSAASTAQPGCSGGSCVVS